jgi:hypothetical protein
LAERVQVLATDRTWDGGSSGSFNAAANWNPNGAPTLADNLTISTTNAIVTLTADANARLLTVQNGADVDANNHDLNVATSIIVLGAGSQLIAGNSGGIDISVGVNLSVSGGARLINEGGLIRVPDGIIDIGAGSSLRGHGAVAMGSLFRNDGTIRPEGGTLAINGAGTNRIDADGINENGILDVTAGFLQFNAPLQDAFDGVATVGAGAALFVDSAWTLGAGGTLHLNGGTALANAANIAGDGAPTINGAVTASGYARFISRPTFASGGSTSVAAGGGLFLNAGAVFAGGSITGEGTILLDGNSTVTGGTVIQVKTFIWGGSVSTMSINSGDLFVINSDSIGGSYGGTLTVNGHVAVNTDLPWRLDGRINLNQISNIPTLNGTSVEVYGSIRATLQAIINSPVTFEPTADVQLASGSSSLALQGLTTYYGGKFTGNGTLRQVGDATVRAATAIEVATFDWDGNEDSQMTLLAPLSITSDTIETGNPLTAGYNGTATLTGGSLLTVFTAQPWRLDGRLIFNRTSGNAPVVAGSEIKVYGNITASNGASFINAPVDLQSSASIVVNPSATLTLGSAIYRGGSYTGAGTLAHLGDATFLADTTINTGVFDMDGVVENPANLPSHTLNPGVHLTLNAGAIDSDPDGGFSGTITVGNAAQLTVLTGAPWRLDGTLNLNDTAAAGVPVVGGAALNLAGTINATGAPLFATRLVNYGGTVNVSLGGGLGLLSGFSSTNGAILAKMGPGSFTIGGTNNHAPGSIVRIYDGKVNFLSNASGGTGGANLAVQVVSAPGSVEFNSTQFLDSLFVSGGVATLTSAGGRVIVARLANAQSGGKIDLTNNGAIFTDAALANTRASLASGYNGGAWNGPGINSSTAAANPGKALGYGLVSSVFGISGTQTATFLGQTVSPSYLLIRYTLYGDATLDQVVDFNDLVRLAQNYNVADGARMWSDGDFTFDGNVDFNDLVKLAQNYNTSLPALAVPGASPEFNGDLAEAFAAVPEPSLASWFMAISGLALFRRRRSVQ